MLNRFYRLMLFITLIILSEFYCFQAVKFISKHTKAPISYIIWAIYFILVLLWYIIIFSFQSLREMDNEKTLRIIIIVFFVGFLAMRIGITFFYLLDDIRRFFTFIYQYLIPQKTLLEGTKKGISRSDFLQSLGILLGVGIFSTLLYGIKNRYNYKLNKIKLRFDNLPQSFKNLKIIQISDIHSGSFTDKNAVQKGIDLILKQNADLILFTGDLVNNEATEMEDYKSIFSQLKAPLGVFSILGNHDYGDYHNWKTEDEKIANLEKLKQTHKQLGWKLLLDENFILEKNNEKIALIGVENISAKGFQNYGNMAKAYEGVQEIPFKILLSHDPSH
nr:metallophosphoesterase [Chitinophagaceae bacterium]